MQELILNHNGKDYSFRLSWKSKVILDKMIRENNKKMKEDAEAQSIDLSSPLVKEIAIKVQELNSLIEKEIDVKENKEKLASLQLAVIELQAENFDLEEVAYILVANAIENRGVTREIFNEMIENLEKQKGVEGVDDFLREVKEIAFLEIQKSRTKQEEKIRNRQELLEILGKK